jgi:hypothetical protein
MKTILHVKGVYVQHEMRSRCLTICYRSSLKGQGSIQDHNGFVEMFRQVIQKGSNTSVSHADKDRDALCIPNMPYPNHAYAS